LITFTNKLYNSNAALQVIGDITCDEGGSVQACKATGINNPAYVFDPNTNQIVRGYEGEGIVVSACDQLPSAAPRDASEGFSKQLLPYVRDIMRMNYLSSLENSGLAPELQQAVLLWNGKPTERTRQLVE